MEWVLHGAPAPQPREEGCFGFDDRGARSWRTLPTAELGCNASCVGRRACRECRCALCGACVPPENVWYSRASGAVHAITTDTQPRFVFAFQPLDPDMERMRRKVVLEPLLTLAWQEAIRSCCRQPAALVVDVGGNFGWYTLYSVALGCDVVVFEPASAWQKILRLGLALNPGFSSKVRVYPNVVYNRPGNYSLKVPRPRKGVLLGMTGMVGSAGLMKGYAGKQWADTEQASAVRIDDLVQRDVCMLKVDVEGYEPQADPPSTSPPTPTRTVRCRRSGGARRAQVFETSTNLLRRFAVPALQLELTKGYLLLRDKYSAALSAQTCMQLRMLAFLDAHGYELRQAGHSAVDHVAMPSGSWEGYEVWDKLSPLPSRRAEALAKKLGQHRMVVAFFEDIKSYSTNIVARRHEDGRRRDISWPAESPKEAQMTAAQCVQGVVNNRQARKEPS